MLFLVPIENAVPLRLPSGKQVTIVNDSAVDVYYDYQAEPLNATPVGGVPTQSPKLVATTGFLQLFPFPGIIWFRAATATQIKVMEG